MTGLHLSRLSLRREPAIEALAKQLLPDDKGDRAHAAHRLVWSAFAGDTNAKRSFLFRETTPRPGAGFRQTGFLVLSKEQPKQDHPVLQIESKPFAPQLRAGDRLGFSLRANPTVQTGAPHAEGGKTKRHDVVMAALHDLPKGERGEKRAAMINEAGFRWLSERAARSGFKLLASQPPDIGDDEDDHALLRIDGYEQWRFERIGRRGRISVLDFDGILEVTDPDALLTSISSGFGRARAFGCGLMLLRRL